MENKWGKLQTVKLNAAKRLSQSLQIGEQLVTNFKQAQAWKNKLLLTY